MLKPLLIGSVLLLSTGCMKTYVMTAGGVTGDTPMDALMVSTRVQTIQESNESGGIGALVETATDLAANSQIDEFGSGVVDTLSGFLSTHGYTVVVDEAKAKSLQNVDWGEAGNKLSTLSGGYTDPRGAAMMVMPKMLFRDKVLQTTATKLSLDQGDAMLFITVNILESRKWLIMRLPYIQTTVLVADHSGQALLAAQGLGSGDTSVIVIDRSPANLQVAMDRAVEALGAAEVTPMK